MTPISPDIPIGVVGAGTMGHGIAQVAAAAGHQVFLFDAQAGAAEAGKSSVAKALERVVAKGRMTAEDRDALLERIAPCTTLEQLAGAGLVVEAVTEDLAVKQAVFKALESLVGETAILASNTSSISLTSIGAALQHAERLVGMHFFNPAPLMALVEVVSGLATSPEAAGAVFETALAWGKVPVHAKSTPGFIVNRVARPFYAEAYRTLEDQGADVATVDAVLREAGGFRMGPFQLMDLVGLDVNFAVTRSVYDAYFQDPRYKPSLIQQEMVAGGYLGRKSGRGFYDYAEGASRPEPATAPPQTAPDTVTVHGDLGIAEPLVERMQQAGLAVHREAGDSGYIRLGRGVLALTDGRPATQRCAVEGQPIVVFDLALDYLTAPRIAVARGDQTPEAALNDAIGLFQALGMQVSVLDDYPGLIVMRTVCMLGNEAATAVGLGVAEAEGVDTAMLRGLNYPRGPLDWADAIGPSYVLGVVDNLASWYGEDKYRAAPLVRRQVYARQRLRG